MRQNFSLIKQFFLAAAAQAHSVSAQRNQGLPPVVWLLLFLPALRLLPGHTPAQELRCLLEGNCSISAPSRPELPPRCGPGYPAPSAAVALADPGPPRRSGWRCHGPFPRSALPETPDASGCSGSSSGDDRSSDALPVPG